MKITDFLKERDVPFEFIVHHDTYAAQRMAQALDVPGREVAKSVLLRIDHGYQYIVAVLPADKMIDFDRVSKILNDSHVELATEIELAERCPDCEIGALPPFGSQYGMKTFVDETLAVDQEIVFEGNTHHEAIRMEFLDYKAIEEPLIVCIARECQIDA